MVNFVSAIREDERYTSNSVVRKWLSKLTGRISVVALPPPRMSNIRKQGQLCSIQRSASLDSGFGVAAKVLRGGQSLESRTRLLDEEPVDITEDAERALEYLFAALEDRVSDYRFPYGLPLLHILNLISLELKDTIVRYSAAKWVARIAERLPSDFMDQVLENILSLFSIHAVDEDGDLDIPTAAEATWHGACLACAEFARRGLVSDSRLPDLLHWMYKVSALLHWLGFLLTVQSTRLCTSIYAKGLIPSAQAYATQPRTSSGPLQGHRPPRVFGLSPLS